MTRLRQTVCTEPLNIVQGIWPEFAGALKSWPLYIENLEQSRVTYCIGPKHHNLLEG